MLFRSELNLKSQSLRGVQGKPLRHQPLLRPTTATEYDIHQELASLYDEEDDIEGGGSLKFTRASSLGGLNRAVPKIATDNTAHEKLRQRQRCVFAFFLIALMSLAFYTFIVFNRGHHRPPPSGMYPDTTFIYFPPKPSAVPVPVAIESAVPLSPSSTESKASQSAELVSDQKHRQNLLKTSSSEVKPHEDAKEENDESSMSDDYFNAFLETEAQVSPLESSSNHLLVWHLSDLHIDPFYSPLEEHVQKGKRKVCRPPTGSFLYDPVTGAKTGKVADRLDETCLELEGRGWKWEPQTDTIPNESWPFGRPNCDPPLLTLHASLNFIEQQQTSENPASPTIIVVTGDIVGHKIKCPYVVSQVRHVVMKEIRNRLPNAIVLFVPGNNDYDTKDAPTTENHLKLNRDIEQFTTIPPRFESNQAENLFKTTGAYVYDVPLMDPSASPLRFIMFNSVLFSSGNMDGLSNDDVENDNVYGKNRASQLAFLREELERARKDNVKVVLVTHSPPGAKADLLQEDENLLLEIISPFAEEGRILAMLTGDLSRNEVRSIDTSVGCVVNPDTLQDAKAPLTVLVSGGISSRKGGAPSVRRMTFGSLNSEATLLDWTDFALKQPQKPTDKFKWTTIFNFKSVSMSPSETANPQAVNSLLKQAFKSFPADIVFELANIYGMYRAGGNNSLAALQLDQERWREAGDWILTRLQQEFFSAAWTPYSGSKLLLSSKYLDENNALHKSAELSSIIRNSQDTTELSSAVLSALHLTFELYSTESPQDTYERKGDIAVSAARQIFDKLVKSSFSRRLRCAAFTRSEKCFLDCKKEFRKIKGEKKILKRGFEELAVFLHEQSETYNVMREEL